MIPPLSLPKVQNHPLKQAAAIPRANESTFTPSQVADTTSLRRVTNPSRASNSAKRRKSLSHTGTPSNSDEDLGDLRGTLNEIHENRMRNKIPKESQRSVKVVSEYKAKPYHALPRQYGYGHKGTPAKSNRERSGLPDDDRRPQWDPMSEYENRDNTGPHRRSRPRNRNRSTGSKSDGRANRSMQNRDRSRKRNGQDNPTQTQRGRGWTAYRQQRLLQITESITCHTVILPD